MPRILETDAFALARGIDAMDEAQRPQALDILARYKRQQEDNGEPEWPSQAQARQDASDRLRGFFDDLKTVDAAAPSLAAVLPYSDNPDEDRARVANTAYLASRYGKPAEEIGGMYELYRDDYATRFLQAPKGLDDLAFHASAKNEIARLKQKEDTEAEGVKAALRGDDVIPALQAWQAKNLDRMPDSTEFTRGFLQARERAGDHLEFADALLKQIESNTGLTKGDGKQRPTPASRETADQFEVSLATLATMKPKDRKQVYAIIGAKAEAAGYDPKGFWSQMLSELGKGMARMGSTVTTQAGVTGDVLANFPAMMSNTMTEGEFDATDASIARRQGIGEMYDEVAGIVAGDVDPVRPVISWMNDTVETGLIQAPGAVAPFMLASAAMGPYGAGALFTADFAEQNRRDLRAQGMDNVQAMSIAAAAAPLQAAAESLSNALQLGRFPAVQRALASFTKPIGGGAGAVARYVQNSTLALATEFTEEQVQDNLIVPATQEIFGALSEDVPDVDWSMYRNRAVESTPELLSILVPMALVFGGTMTAAQANLSGALVSSQGMLEAAGYSAAQANEVRLQTTEEAKIGKAREFWGARDGTPQTIEAAAQTVGERMRLLRNDTAAAQADLERRGILPRMLHAAEDRWKLTFNDGSTADFNSHSEADAARWQWATDQLGKVHLATRSALAQLESGAAVGREFAVEFKPDAMTAAQAVEEGRVDPAQIDRRVQQGEAVGETAAEPVNEADAFDAATLTDKATSDYLSSLQILGSSVNEFKDGILRTTIRLYEGANVLTLVEEKLEGDAKQIVASKPGRAWMLRSLRNYEQVSGDKLFRDVADNSELRDDDLIEAWSSLGQSYLVGKSKKGAAIGKGGARRIFADVLKAGMAGAMNSETQFFNAVWRRAAKLSKLKREGKLRDDLAEELERQLGIDSQAKQEAEAAIEAEAIANEALYAGGASYSEENLGPNGETFSLSRAVPADSSRVVQMPDGARLVGPTTFSIRAFHGTPHKVDKFSLDKIGTGEGAQAYGWGLYFAEERKVAEMYLRAGTDRAPREIDTPSGKIEVSDLPEVLIKAFEANWEAPNPFRNAQNFLNGWNGEYYAGTLGAEALAEAKEKLNELIEQGASVPQSNLYTVELIPDEADFLDWDKPLSEQSEKVKAAVEKVITDRAGRIAFGRSGAEIYRNFLAEIRIDGSSPPKLVSQKMAALGIPGIRYLDGGSRINKFTVKANDGTGDVHTFTSRADAEEMIRDFGMTKATIEEAGVSRNFVIFDESLVKILEENGKPVSGETFSIRSVSPAQDAEYMAAVESGDVAKQQAMVDAAAKVAGYDSPKVFHGTQAKFNVFDESKIGSANGRSEGSGFYFTTDENTASGYQRNGGNMVSAYLKVNKPLDYNAKPFTALQVRKLLKAVALTEAKDSFDGNWKDGFLANFGDTYSKSIDSVVADSVRYFTDEDSALDQIGGIIGSGVDPATVNEALRTSLGYDAFFSKGFSGEGRSGGDIYVAMKSNQIKSADPVTRNADGNVIPLSQRFDPERNEITFSLRPAVKLNGVIKEGQVLHLDAWGEHVRSLVPAYQREDLRNGRQVADYLRANPSILEDGIEGYMTPEGFMEKTAAELKYGGADDRFDSIFAGSFSIRSGDFASRMSAAFSPFQRSPELRMAIAQVAKQRAQRLGAEWIEKAGVLRTVGSIAKEQGIREALGYDQRINAYLESLTPSARQELEFEPASLEDDPLISAMLQFGRLMSFTTAKREGKVDAKSGDYDGAPWLPPSFFSSGGSVRWAEVTKDGETTTYTKEIPNDVMDDIKSGKATLKRKSRSIPAKGGIMPDQMAQAMFDAGLLPDAFTGTLWAALESRIASTKKNKAAHREAVQAYKAAQRAARADAKLEAEAWANQTRKAAGSPKAQRDMLKGALRLLDGILAAAPPEVRARVGGYVKLAGLATDEAMLQEIERRIEKLNVELEKWLKKEGVAEIQKLLKRGRPEAEAGKRGKGKDPDMHALFAAAERAIPMTAEAVDGELARLDTLIGGDTLTPEQEALAITERGIVELVGDLKSADSGRVFSALDSLREIYEGGWLKWKLRQIEKREERAGMRADFIADTGKGGLKPERDAADKAAVTLLGKIKGGFLSLSSFQEVLSYAFGSKSDRVKALVDAEREASGQYEDVTQALADEVEALFSDLAGGSVLAGERLRYDMAQRTIKTGKGELSQLEAIQALLMWRQEDGRRHMEGAMDENGKPVGPWNYDQAWIDEITAALTPEARSVMSWLSQKYASEHPALNALYRERYGVNMPAHDNYAPITVQPVQTKSGEVNDPVSGAAISSGSILVPGSLRARSRSAIAEPDFRDSLQTFMAHTRQLEYWKAYYDLAFEASAILGNREVLNAVKAKGGEPAATALRKWIDAIAQGGFRDASSSLGLHKMLSRMTGRAASVGLLGRFSTLLVQSTQLGAASVKMPVGAYLIRLSKLLTGNLSFRDAVNSPFIQRRYKSAPPIVRQALEGLGVASRPNQITRATRHLGNLLSGADAMFTAGTYAMILDYHRGTGRALGLTGAELETHAHTEAERDTEAVAQPTRMATRSLAELTSTNPLAKVSWAYASEARQKIALMAWATMNAKAEPAQFAKTAFLVFGIGGLMTQILKNLWREAKGDDDESKWSPERLTLSALAGPLHGVPLASELMGDQGMLSGVAWAWPALKDIASGEGDMRDVDTLLSTMGLFNDTAAGIASLSHAGLDAAKVLENLASEK